MTSATTQVRPIPRRTGSLRSRLLVAFLLVALSSVAVVAIAALLGSTRGIAASNSAARQQAAESTSQAAAIAYQNAGGWTGADLTSTATVAQSANARMLITDDAGRVVDVAAGTDTGMGMGPGNGMGDGSGMGQGMDSANSVTAPVVVSGTTVGQVRLGFGTNSTTGRGVAWTWILVATIVAAAVAAVAAWLVSRRLSAPLQQLTAAARAFANGDRDARSGVTGPGEIGELGLAFDQTADQVTQGEAARRRQSADIAHELRTPVTVLQAELEELRDGLVQPDEQVLTRLHEQSLRLGRVVNDLADLAAAEESTLSMRPRRIALADVARDELRAHESAMRAADLVVGEDLDAEVFVWSDPDRLGQAVGNLLANATKYCRPNDQVMLSVKAVGQAADLALRDTGPGIPAADLPHVFDRLWRGRGGADGIAGSGIGLSVARQIVEASGGTIRVESDGTSGTTFTISLPTFR
ncbi:MAG: ATP-binding protein [Candidatus Nanopelagicales bacterium]